VPQICHFIIETVFPILLADSYYNNSSAYYVLGLVMLMTNDNW